MYTPDWVDDYIQQMVFADDENGKTAVQIHPLPQDDSGEGAATPDTNLIVAPRSGEQEATLPSAEVMTLTSNDAMFFTPLSKYNLKAETAKQQIYTAMSDGEDTVDEIAERCGMSASTVRRYLKEMENDSVTLRTELKVIDVSTHFRTQRSTGF